ncbi:hypothetical protein [Marivirga arenosa]|uniref:SpoIIAA-like protein n=1 Tax=Marivirga arenosa TaxID=3059076 RepID=A0AA51ZW04_9BACT|nr:hypothetical protein [Marivirga sp. BKB1-2]WNB17787.1 hypothetical protein QYS47_28160 [Marivirga sp. BKB1-2]
MEKEATKELVFEEKYVKAYVLHDLKCLELIWDGNLKEEDYKRTWERSLETMKKYKLIYFFSDISNQGIIGANSRKWFEEEILPNVKAVGLKKAGTITDASIFKRYYLNLILKSIGKFGVPFKLCGSREEVIKFISE